MRDASNLFNGLKFKYFTSRWSVSFLCHLFKQNHKDDLKHLVFYCYYFLLFYLWSQLQISLNLLKLKVKFINMKCVQNENETKCVQGPPNTLQILFQSFYLISHLILCATWFFVIFVKCPNNFEWKMLLSIKVTMQSKFNWYHKIKINKSKILEQHLYLHILISKGWSNPERTADSSLWMGCGYLVLLTNETHHK